VVSTNGLLRFSVGSWSRSAFFGDGVLLWYRVVVGVVRGLGGVLL